MSFTPEQTAYVKAKVESNAGFNFVAAGPNSKTGKMYLVYTSPAHPDVWSFNEPIKSNRDWLTDEAQFREVADSAVAHMVEGG